MDMNLNKLLYHVLHLQTQRKDMRIICMHLCHIILLVKVCTLKHICIVQITLRALNDYTSKPIHVTYISLSMAIEDFVMGGDEVLN